MNDEVQDLGEQLLAAAWGAARIVDASDNQADRLCNLLAWIQETEAQLAGLRMQLIHDARLAGAVKVVDHARISSRNTTGRAVADIRLAAEFAENYSLIHQAVCDGVISFAQAEAMVMGLKKLPVRFSRGQLEQCQTTLLSEAAVLGPHELRILATKMIELLDPEAAEEDQARRLARDERRAKAGRSLRIKPDFHGSMRITGQLPLADAALLQSQLDALLPPASSYANDDVTPSMDARRADALVALAQIAANSGDLPEHGLDRPHVHVTLPFDALTSGLGTIGLLGAEDQCAQLTAGEARRLACDANLIPVVLGGASQPLDVGRTHRLVPKPLRTALSLRDQGCAFPHCTATPTACEAHHIQPWWTGGETNLSNTVLLCPRHHRLVEPDPQQSEESQWQAQIDETTGLPVFIPPRYIDLARRPRQHRRLRLGTMKLIPDQECAPESEPARVFEPPEPVNDPWHPEYVLSS